MTLRSAVLVAHRWLGLSSAIVLSIVGATGAIMAWPEIYSFVRRAAGLFHERLALGRPGWWIVVATTIVAVAIELGGLYLWWRTKTVRIRRGPGWRPTLTDLHHSAGAIGLLVMLLLAVTGIGMAFTGLDQNPTLRPALVAWHSGRSFPWPVRIIYTLGSLGFVVQSATGVFMWWSLRRARRARALRQT